MIAYTIVTDEKDKLTPSHKWQFYTAEAAWKHTVSMGRDLEFNYKIFDAQNREISLIDLANDATAESKT